MSALYGQDFQQKNIQPCCQRLTVLNIEARDEKILTGEPARKYKQREKPGKFYQKKQKESVREEKRGVPATMKVNVD